MQHMAWMPTGLTPKQTVYAGPAASIIGRKCFVVTARASSS